MTFLKFFLKFHLLYCTQARALTTNELSDPKISCKVAEKMAKIHSLNIPVSKEPDWLWNTMERWLLNLEEILKNYTTKNAEELASFEKVRKIDFRRELGWLKMTVENADYPVVFCHNDLQEGNILFKEQNSGFASPGSSTEQLRYVLPRRRQCDHCYRIVRHFECFISLINKYKNQNIIHIKSFLIFSWKLIKKVQISFVRKCLCPEILASSTSASVVVVAVCCCLVCIHVLSKLYKIKRKKTVCNQKLAQPDLLSTR